jgi:hypothetical protein
MYRIVCATEFLFVDIGENVLPLYCFLYYDTFKLEYIQAIVHFNTRNSALNTGNMTCQQLVSYLS